MKDEIKEILDKLNKNKNEIKDYCYYPDDVLSCDDLIKLLDYITNLQEEYETELYENLKLSEWLVKKQKRIEKAREYINTHQLFKYIYDEEELFEIITDKEAKKDLENILNGGDDNE